MSSCQSSAPIAAEEIACSSNRLGGEEIPIADFRFPNDAEVLTGFVTGESSVVAKRLTNRWLRRPTDTETTRLVGHVRLLVFGREAGPLSEGQPHRLNVTCVD